MTATCPYCKRVVETFKRDATQTFFLYGHRTTEGGLKWCSGGGAQVR